jgi:AraC-like DNA-binding protein
VRARLLTAAAPDAITTTRHPDLSLYRFSRATPLAKAVTFGVTLGVVAQGAKRVRIGGHELVIDTEHALVITRDIPYESLPCTPPYLGLGVTFPPERVARALLALAEAGGSVAAEPIPAFSLALDGKLVDAIDRLLRSLDDPLDGKLIAPLVLDELLFRLLRSDAAAAVRGGVGPPQDATRVLEAMQFIRSNLARKLTVDGLARVVGMSPSHFAHRFTAVARMSPMRYVREVRLERARSLLGEHGARAGEVASRVGFESAAHFAREFKRRYGAPPSQFHPR